MSTTKSPALEGRNVACPYLMVSDIEKELNFIENVFGAEIIERVYHPDGDLIHGEARIRNSVIMLGKAKKGFPQSEALVYVYTPDVQFTYLQALEQGAESLSKPELKFYGLKEATVKDDMGVQWRIAEVVQKLTKEEMEENLKNELNNSE
jgi:uncharacterized glyoxalase superfamily protein PhnB